MKPETLFRALVPATLFLCAGRLRAQDMTGSAPPAAQPEVSPAGAPAPAAPTPAQAAQNAKLTPKEQALLEKYDKNHDGVIDDEELADAHSSLHTEQLQTRLESAKKLYARLLEKFDTDKKGSLSPEEQVEAAAAIQSRAPQVYKALLTRFDKDGDGKLDASELKTMFDQLAMAPQAEATLKTASAEAPQASAETAAPRPPGQAQRGAMARKLYDDLLARFDASKKGFLNPDEQLQAIAALKTERPYVYQRLLARFDKDHDGTLDAAETKTLFDTLGDLPPAPKEKS